MFNTADRHHTFVPRHILAQALSGHAHTGFTAAQNSTASNPAACHGDTLSPVPDPGSAPIPVSVLPVNVPHGLHKHPQVQRGARREWDSGAVEWPRAPHSTSLTSQIGQHAPHRSTPSCTQQHVQHVAAETPLPAESTPDCRDPKT